MTLDTKIQILSAMALCAGAFIPASAWAAPMYSSDFTAPLTITIEASQWQESDMDTGALGSTFSQDFSFQFEMVGAFTRNESHGYSEYMLDVVGDVSNAVLDLAAGPIDLPSLGSDGIVGDIRGWENTFLFINEVYLGSEYIALEIASSYVTIDDIDIVAHDDWSGTEAPAILSTLLADGSVSYNVPVFFSLEDQSNSLLYLGSDPDPSEHSQWNALDMTVTVSMATTPVPLPAAAWMGFSGLLALGGLRLRQRRT